MESIVIIDSNNKEEVKLTRKLSNAISVLLEQRWGIKNESHSVQVHIDKLNARFIFCTLPLYKRMFFLISFPIWYLKRKKYLEAAGSMIYERKGNYFLLLKPMEMYEKIKSPVGKLVYYKLANQMEAFKSTACHNLLNILVKSLDLPFWLSNGLVIFGAELTLDKNLIRSDTITFLTNEEKISAYSFYASERELAYSYSKGYWTVKYLEEQHPGFLKETFKGCKGEEIVTKIREKLGLDMEDDEKYWIQLDELLVNHYQDKLKN